jgi:hypothetical protein
VEHWREDGFFYRQEFTATGWPSNQLQILDCVICFVSRSQVKNLELKKAQLRGTYSWRISFLAGCKKAKHIFFVTLRANEVILYIFLPQERYRMNSHDTKDGSQ